MVCQGCDCSTPCGSKAAASVSLPPRGNKNNAESSPLLWSTQKTGGTTQYGSASDQSAVPSTHTATTPARKCGNVGGSGVCCKEIVASDSRQLINPDVVRDIILGLADGLVVPFGLCAGLSGLGSTKFVVLGGIAELVSGCVSMACGGYLSAQAEMQHYQFQEQQVRERVARSCSGAIQDEVSEILKPYGVPDEVAALVSAKLQGVEQATRQGQGSLPLPSTAAVVSNSSKSEEDEQLGLTPFILRVGEGLEPISSSRAWQSAVTIGVSYVAGGLLPLFPYIILSDIQDALLTSTIVTGVILLIFGYLKQRFTGGAQGWGYVYGAVSTLAVGGLAAGASWLMVRWLEGDESI